MSLLLWGKVNWNSNFKTPQFALDEQMDEWSDMEEQVHNHITKTE